MKGSIILEFLKQLTSVPPWVSRRAEEAVMPSTSTTTIIILETFKHSEVTALPCEASAYLMLRHKTAGRSLLRLVLQKNTLDSLLRWACSLTHSLAHSSHICVEVQKTSTVPRQPN